MFVNRCPAFSGANFGRDKNYPQKDTSQSGLSHVGLNSLKTSLIHSNICKNSLRKIKAIHSPCQPHFLQPAQFFAPSPIFLSIQTHMPAMPQAQRSMKSDFDSDFDIQSPKHRDQNRIFIQTLQRNFSYLPSGFLRRNPDGRARAGPRPAPG